MKKALIVILFVLFLVSCDQVTDKQNFEYDPNNLFSENLLAVEINGKWGFVDKNADVIIDALYDGASAFYEGLAIVKTNEKYQLIDKNGKNQLSNSYDYLYRDIESKRILYLDKEKEGIMNLKGEIITDALYDYIGVFSEGIAKVRVDNKYGYINIDGKRVTDIKYDGSSKFSHGFAAVAIGENWGYINKSGEVVVDFMFKYGSIVDENKNAVVENTDGTFGLYNLTTQSFVVNNADNIEPGSSFYIVNFDGQWKLYKPNGLRFNNITYDYGWDSNGYFANLEIGEDDLNIWFNKDGTEFQTAPWEDSSVGFFNFNDEKIPYMMVKDEEYLDLYLENKTYRFETDRIYQMLDNEIFIAIRNSKFGVIDKTGKILVEFLYDYLYKTADGYVGYEINGKYGAMDSNFKTIVTATFTKVNTIAEYVTYQ